MNSLLNLYVVPLQKEMYTDSETLNQMILQLWLYKVSSPASSPKAAILVAKLAQKFSFTLSSEQVAFADAPKHRVVMESDFLTDPLEDDFVFDSYTSYSSDASPICVSKERLNVDYGSINGRC